jgi:ribosomal-protein-alanine N-acetyltransferase
MLQFQTDRLIIREINLADTGNIHILHSLPETDKFNTLGIPDNIQVTEGIVGDWLYSHSLVPRTAYIFCLEQRSTNEFTGLMAMNLSRPKNKSAEVWYKIHTDHWNKGYTTEALKALLAYGFDTLGLHRISAGCAVENIASIRVLEKAGMQREGRCRGILPIRGQWLDNYIYAILEEDYFAAGASGK